MDLKHIVECFNGLLQGQQFTEIIKKRLHHHLLEGIISHFFPERNKFEPPYSKEDVMYFVSFASEQTSWKNSLPKVYVSVSNTSLMYSCIS